MCEVFHLMYFEYKKILKQSAAKIALAAVFAVILFSGGIAVLNGSITAGGEVVSSGYQNEKDRKAEEISYAGEAVDEKLLREARDTFKKYPSDYTTNAYETKEAWDAYRMYARPYNSLVSLTQSVGADILTMDLNGFYEYRRAAMEEMQDEQDLSAGQKEFLKKLDDQVEKPFRYDYTRTYRRFISLQYTNGIFTAFAVAVCLAGIFAGEYTSGVDGLMLSSKYGKNKVIAAKLLTGFSFSIVVSLVFLLACFLELGILHGFEGADAPIQLGYVTSSYPLTMLETVEFMFLYNVLAVCLIAAIAMLLSALARSSFSVIIVITVILFGGIFLEAPYQYKFLRVLLHFLPGKLMSGGAVLDDMPLKIGAAYFTPYQYGALIVIPIILLLAFGAFRKFRAHQVG